MIIVLSIFVLFFALLSVHSLRHLNKIYKSKENHISFKEAINLTNLPIVTFINNGNRFNFILDSGASNSSVNKEILELLDYNNCNFSGNFYGVDGKRISTNYVSVGLQYKNITYFENFQIVDLSLPFSNFKNDFGVTLHGILGNSFFQRHKYILDFNELIAYSYKK